LSNKRRIVVWEFIRPRLGSIFQGEEKMLNLSIYFPTDMGNEFQQKTLSVAFIFTAYMSDSTIVVNDEDVPIAPAITSGPEPITDPVLINIPDDSILSAGETSPEVYYIAGLIMVMIVLKTVQVLMKRSRHVD